MLYSTKSPSNFKSDSYCPQINTEYLGIAISIAFCKKFDMRIFVVCTLCNLFYIQAISLGFLDMCYNNCSVHL